VSGRTRGAALIAKRLGVSLSIQLAQQIIQPVRQPADALDLWRVRVKVEKERRLYDAGTRIARHLALRHDLLHNIVVKWCQVSPVPEILHDFQRCATLCILATGPTAGAKKSKKIRWLRKARPSGFLVIALWGNVWGNSLHRFRARPLSAF
jgi:hypothetical protein